jgi:hypothetical protein
MPATQFTPPYNAEEIATKVTETTSFLTQPVSTVEKTACKTAIKIQGTYGVSCALGPPSSVEKPANGREGMKTPAN